MDSKLLFLRALTPIHAGMGRGSLEHVDLPVQRDEFNILCIWASSLKGAIRGTLTRIVNSNERETLYKTLGPPPGRGHEFSSSVSFLDARLLFMPVRSLRGVWTYITSPHLVSYLTTYLEGLGRTNLANELQAKIGQFKVPTVSNDKILVKDNTVVLNEVDIVGCKVNNELHKIFDKIVPHEILSLLEKRGLVLVDDDTALSLIQKSILIQYRIRINYATKTVEAGSLWSEEYIPQETIFVSGVTYRPLVRTGADEIFKWFEEKLKNLNYVIWLGGKETIGKGLLKLYLV